MCIFAYVYIYIYIFIFFCTSKIGLGTKGQVAEGIHAPCYVFQDHISSTPSSVCSIHTGDPRKQLTGYRKCSSWRRASFAVSAAERQHPGVQRWCLGRGRENQRHDLELLLSLGPSGLWIGFFIRKLWAQVWLNLQPVHCVHISITTSFEKRGAWLHSRLRKSDTVSPCSSRRIHPRGNKAGNSNGPCEWPCCVAELLIYIWTSMYVYVFVYTKTSRW